MSDYTITNGLINVGGILTETKVRKSRASEEAKLALGLDPARDHKSSIGIASIQEYMIMYAENISQGETVSFRLSIWEQDVKLESIYPGDANQDKFEFEIWREDGEKVFTQVFQRTQTPIQLPAAPLPPNTVIVFTAKADISYLQLCFIPCQIISVVKFPLDRTGNNPGDPIPESQR